VADERLGHRADGDRGALSRRSLRGLPPGVRSDAALGRDPAGGAVLDAGCGGGSFLALLAELVGPGGRIAAFDLAPDNVARVQRQIDGGAFPCPVEARLGSLTALPCPDVAFDAVWCSNALMYLTDPETAGALAEFRRVVRPGGVAAVKDIDLGFSIVAPADPGLLWRLWDSSRHVDSVILGCFRARDLRRWFRQAGLVDVRQRATLIELGPPLRPVERAYVGGQLAQLGGVAARSGVPAADLAFWRAQQDPMDPGYLANHPDLYWSEGHFVVVGWVPARGD
jgi:SAM-dependent methyltransferase